jgi:hypothetical protein
VGLGEGLLAFAGRGSKDEYQRGANMTDPKRDEASSNDEPIPFMQRLLDNPFLLLFLGVASPAVVYLIWGIMDIISIPVAP